MPPAACQLCLLWVGCHSDATRETVWSLSGKLGTRQEGCYFGGSDRREGKDGCMRPLTPRTVAGSTTHQLLNVHQTIHEGLAPLMQEGQI